MIVRQALRFVVTVCWFFFCVFLVNVYLSEVIFAQPPQNNVAQSQQNELRNPDRFFSPNLDGKKDFFPIPLNISDKNIDHWRVDILSKKDKRFVVVKVFESIDEKQYGGSSLDGVFSRSSKKTEPPREIFWDGYDEKGKKMKDGIYYLRFYIRNSKGRENTSPPLPFVLDTIAPKPIVEWKEDFFSPNGDGVKDIFLFQVVNETYGIGDMTIVRVFDDKGKEVRSFFEKAKNSSIVWNGLKEGGEPAPEGRYFVEVTLKDMAENTVVLPKKIITLVRKLEKAEISLSSEGFSPNDDGELDTLAITPSLSSTAGLLSWQIDIKKDKEIVHQIVGEKQLPNEVVFDGKKKDGKIMADGLYDVIFSATFLSGNRPFSEKHSLKIDTKAPEVFVRVENDQSIFRVGNEEEEKEKEKDQKFHNVQNKKGEENKEKKEDEEMQNIDFRVEQKVSGEPEDNYYVFVEDSQKKMVYKKQYLGKVPETFSWDGKNEWGSIVPGSYVYYLTGKDSVGNIGVAKTQPFTIIKGDLDIKLIASRLAFSPNGDGIKDSVVFLLQIGEESLKSFVGAQIAIFDEKKKLVKQFDLKNYKKETTWNGENEEGNVVPDGHYFFQGRVDLSTGEKITLPRSSIYVDRVKIKINIAADSLYFSPNEDGFRDNIAVKHQVIESEILPEYDYFAVAISNDEKKVIRENAWSKDLPKVIRWNGKDRTQKVLPDGVYHYSVFTEDEAGNRQKYLLDDIHLSTKEDMMDLSLSTSIVSTLKQAKKKKS